MKVEIRYAKINRNVAEPVGNISYTLESTKWEKAKLKETIESILDDYRGDALEKLMVEDADGFCCYCDNAKKPIFISDTKVKREPLALVDGLIRRLGAEKVLLHDEFNDPETEVHNTKDVILGKIRIPADQKECICAGVYSYSYHSKWKETEYTPGEVDENGDIISYDEYTYTQYSDTHHTGKNIKLFFTYRDSKKMEDKYRYNHALSQKVTPVFFILKGKIRDEDDKNGFIEEDHKLRQVYFGDEVLWVLKGTKKISYMNCDQRIDRSIVSGFFVKGSGLSETDYLEWYAYSVGEENIVGTVWHHKLENLIEGKFNNSDRIDLDPKRTIYTQVDQSLNKYGMDLSKVDWYKNSGEKSCRIHLTKDETEEMIELFNKAIKAELTGTEIINKVICNCADRLHLDKNSIKKTDVKKLLDLIKKTLSEKKEDSGSRRKIQLEVIRTAVHETGHALATLRLYAEEGGMKEVSIIPGEGFEGVVRYDLEKRNIDMFNVEQAVKEIKISLAGGIAEEIYFGTNSDGWGQDLMDVHSDIVDLLCDRALIFSENGELRFFIEGIGSIPADDALDCLVQRYIEEIRQLLTEEKELLWELPGELMVQKKIKAADFIKLYRFYREKKHVRADVKLCQRMHFALECAMKAYEKDKGSRELLDKLKCKGAVYSFGMLKEYRECGLALAISGICGFDLFTDTVENHICSIVKKGECALGIAVSADGKSFAVFIDGSDRSGEGKGVSYLKKGKAAGKLKYETIAETALIYSSENYM